MGVNKMTLPLKTVKGLMKDAGANRTTKDAVKEMAYRAEYYIEEITIKANKIANYSKRKTISDNDIIIAIEG